MLHKELVKRKGLLIHQDHDTLSFFHDQVKTITVWLRSLDICYIQQT